MKLRLPKVPPGARLRLARLVVTRPYACASPVTAPSTTAAASAASSRSPSPARAAARAHQNSAAPARLTPSARNASQPLVANSADTTETARNPASSASTTNTVSRRADARHSSVAASAATVRTSSLGKV